jgi:uncharacterized protein YodC (DUF2158 family)
MSLWRVKLRLGLTASIARKRSHRRLGCPGLNLGDLVQLKSGGQAMMIVRFVDGRAKAVWFAYGNDRSQFFATHALKTAVLTEEKAARSGANAARRPSW